MNSLRHETVASQIHSRFDANGFCLLWTSPRGIIVINGEIGSVVSIVSAWTPFSSSFSKGFLIADNSRGTPGRVHHAFDHGRAKDLLLMRRTDDQRKSHELQKDR